MKLPLPHGKITAAVIEPEDRTNANAAPVMRGLPSFCRVDATLTPTPDSDIKIEIWMPVSGWNGKYEGTGSGGFAGSIQSWDLANGLRRGYAVANTDMGTAPSTGLNGDALIGHPEKWADWGMRATHEMTVAAKQIIQAYYQKPPQHSYFNGCSTGGEQGLMEAERFPDDYDGIISGAPANNRTRLHVAILWNFVMSERPPEYRIPPQKLPILTQAVLHSCSAQKAVPSDNFLSDDPAMCHWDPQTLLCKAGDAPNCLTAEQVMTANQIYAGPRNASAHVSLYPGVEPGSESGWGSFVPEDGKAPYGSLFKWVFGSDWDWRSFDFNHDVSRVDARLGPKLNATSPDLHTFKASGHKLILYHGWADWLVPPRESVHYYESVVNTNVQDATASHRNKLEETESFFRLFMIPGMAHCGGGPGLNNVDALTPLELWTEKGIAPETLTAWRDDHDKIQMTRPVCAYPLSTHYKEIGDPNDAGSFLCSVPRIEEGPSHSDEHSLSNR